MFLESTVVAAWNEVSVLRLALASPLLLALASRLLLVSQLEWLSLWELG